EKLPKILPVCIQHPKKAKAPRERWKSRTAKRLENSPPLGKIWNIRRGGVCDKKRSHRNMRVATLRSVRSHGTSNVLLFFFGFQHLTGTWWAFVQAFHQ
ncbi:unnamed protein product, partial [Hapterophycus canaliculatus]